MRGVLQRHRIDRDASQRRARAQAHLARVRRDRGGRSGGARSTGASQLTRRPLLIAVAAALFGALFGDGLLPGMSGGGEGLLERIAVRGVERLSAEQVARATGVAPGAALAGVDVGAVRENLERHDWIAEAKTLRLPGGALVVGVVERRPVATVTLDDTLFAVDERGAPFAPLDPQAEPGLVRLVAEDALTPREPSPELARAVRLAHRLPELGMAPPAQISIAASGDPEGYALELAALPARVVLGRADLDGRLEDLALLLAARPDAVAGATSIDLRFANQVVLRSGPARDGSANNAAGRGGASPRNRQPTG